MLVSPVPGWVIRKVWKIREGDIPKARQKVHDRIALFCSQVVLGSENDMMASDSHTTQYPRIRFIEQLNWLNAYLSLVYESNLRVSTVLTNLGYDENHLQIIRSQNLEQFVNSIVASITNRLLAFTDGERLFVILNRRLKIGGTAPDTLHSLGQQLGISRERVRQLETKAQRRCRHKTSKEFLESTLRVLADTMIEGSNR